jgi:hypothetical protein
MKGMESAANNKSEVLDLEENESGIWEYMPIGTEAKALIEEIKGIDQMSAGEQLEAIVNVMEDLSPKDKTEVKAKNGNRFIFRELREVAQALDAKAKAIEATEAYRKTMEGLGMEAGSIINEKA